MEGARIEDRGQKVKLGGAPQTPDRKYPPPLFQRSLNDKRSIFSNTSPIRNGISEH